MITSGSLPQPRGDKYSKARGNAQNGPQMSGVGIDNMAFSSNTKSMRISFSSFGDYTSLLLKEEERSSHI